MAVTTTNSASLHASTSESSGMEELNVNSSATNIYLSEDENEEATAQDVLDSTTEYAFADDVSYDDVSSIVSDDTDIVDEGYVSSASTMSALYSETNTLSEDDSLSEIISAMSNDIKGESIPYSIWQIVVDSNEFIATLYYDGTLTINGTGDIYFNNATDNTNYWNNSANEVSVKRAIIGPGVTGVGSYLFYGCTDLMSIEMPEGVKSVGISACEGTNLLSLHLPDSIETIGDNAFVA